MGQSSSNYVLSQPTSHRRTNLTTAESELLFLTQPSSELIQSDMVNQDFISELPDECLACILQFLSSTDRRNCSLVSQRWLRVEGQTRHRLVLNASAQLLPSIPSLFSRFDSVTKLALRCDRRSVSLNDDALILISLRCPKLSRLKLRSCRELTHLGMAALATHCKCLKKVSCGSSTFGAKGMNALLDHSSSLEELSIKRLRGITEVGEPIGPGKAASSLKSVCLKELYNGQSFAPLIVGAKNLKTLKLLRCFGDWDRVFEAIAERKSVLVEIHLERLQVSDFGLQAISNCSELEVLHLVKTPECTNNGIVSIAEKCRLLRKLHIDGWKTNRIGNEGLTAIAKHCFNIQELVLIGIDIGSTSIDAIATHCQKLERLALCGSETIGDEEISCIAEKCVMLKKFCIKGCPVSDEGIEAFARGCPNLVKIKVKKCRKVTREVGDWLRMKRRSLAVSLDVDEVEAEAEAYASASDVGGQEDGIEFPLMASEVTGAAAADAPSSSTGRSSSFKSRFGFIGGKVLAACTFRKWSNRNCNSSGSVS